VRTYWVRIENIIERAITTGIIKVGLQ